MDRSGVTVMFSLFDGDWIGFGGLDVYSTSSVSDSSTKSESENAQGVSQTTVLDAEEDS